jgi:hypothetical protein
MPCRGTGQVISALAGTPTAVRCPWCEGSGLRRADIDAQAQWPEGSERSAEDQGAAPAGEAE